MKEAFKIIGCAVVILIVIMWIGPHVISTPAGAAAAPAKNNSPKVDLIDIYVSATEAVKAQLKAPATAKFSELGVNQDAKIEPYGYNQWICSGHVDSQNSFGANLRSTWSAYVFKSDSAERVDYFEIDGQTFGKLPSRIPFPTRKP